MYTAITVDSNQECFVSPETTASWANAHVSHFFFRDLDVRMKFTVDNNITRMVNVPDISLLKSLEARFLGSTISAKLRDPVL